MNHKRILALSITSAMVLAACQQPAPAPVIASPTVTNVTATPNTVTQGSGVSTVITFSTTNGGGTISSAKASLAGSDSSCALVSGSTTNYSCTVPVPSSLGTGSKTVTVTVTNNAPTGNTVSSSTTVTVNAPAPVNGPSFTVTGPATVAAGSSANATLVISNLVAGTGTITGVTATLNGVVTNCNLTASGNCVVPVPTSVPNGSNTIAVTATNSSGISSSQTVTVGVTGGTGTVQPPIPGANPVAELFVEGGVAAVTAQAVSGNITSAVLVITKPDGSTTTVPINGAIGLGSYSGNTPLSAADISAPGAYTVTLTVTNSGGQQAVTFQNFTVATAPVNTGGGTVGTGGPVILPTSDAALFSFNNAAQFTYLLVDQRDANGTTGGLVLNGNTINNLLYLRGTATVQQIFAAYGRPIAAGAVVDFENTTSGISTRYLPTDPINTTTFGQGEIFRFIARNNPTGGSGGLNNTIDAFVVFDNDGPQTPKVARISELSEALTSRYGNWVRGRDQNPRLNLVNQTALDDNPQRPGGSAGTGTSKFQPAVGIRQIRYYAVPATNGDPGSVTNLADLVGVTATTGSARAPGARLIKAVTPGLNNSADFATALSPNPANLTLLADGKYVVFAVAVDFLGNANKLNFADSFILGVDTVGPQGTLAIRDRGPLDVHATGPFCDRVDITNNRINAPSDIYPALYLGAGATAPADLNISPRFITNGALNVDYAFVSGCALISATVNDVGVGFDGANIGGGFGVGNISPVGSSFLGFINGLIIGGINPGTTLYNNAGLLATVVNLNTVSSGEQQGDLAATDLLGNPAAIKSNPFVVDNQAPDLNFRAPGVNGSNNVSRWTRLGLQVDASDRISGLRFDSALPSNFDKGVAFYYGTDPENNNTFQFEGEPTDIQGAYNNTLVQIDPTRLERLRADQVTSTFGTNFNVPLPSFNNMRTSQRFVGGNLNLWSLVVDRAGNARGALRTVNVTGDSAPVILGGLDGRLPPAATGPRFFDPAFAVDPISPNVTPPFNSDPNSDKGFGGYSLLNPVTNLLVPVALPEDGVNVPYQGFTALNRSVAGLVPRLTNDQLNPLFTNGTPRFTASLNSPLPRYGILPANAFNSVGTPNNGTPWYELRLENTTANNFNGDTAFTQGIGKVTFAYRVPDPVVAAIGAATKNSEIATVNQINPANYWDSSPYTYVNRANNAQTVTSDVLGISGPIYKRGGDPDFLSQPDCEAYFSNFVKCALLLDNVTYPTSGGTAFRGAKSSDFVPQVVNAGTIGVRRVGGAPVYFPIVVSSPLNLAANTPRVGRFLYNLPEWMGGQSASSLNVLRPTQYIGYIWNTIGQDVTPQSQTNGSSNEPFRAIFDARLGAGQYDLGEDLINFPNSATNPFAFDPDGTDYDGICTNNLSLNAQTVCKTGGIAVFAYNNYGALTVQAKGNIGVQNIEISRDR